MNNRLKSFIGLIIILIAGIIASFLSFDQLFEYNGIVARIIFFAVIIIEVIIAPIPGGIIGFLGAAQFGFWQAWPIMYAGNVIGGLMGFFLSRELGQDFAEKHIPKKIQRHYAKLIDEHPKALWFMYAIPIFPIDIISILLGLTRIHYKKLLLILITALPVYTGIIAFVGDKTSSFLPAINYMGVAGTILLIVLLVYPVIKY